MGVGVGSLSRRVSHTSLILTTENAFQAISPGVETLGLPAPSTQSLLHSTGQPLTKNGMEFNDSHVKCTSLQFVMNTNHMKVSSDSIGPCDCHVT